MGEGAVYGGAEGRGSITAVEEGAHVGPAYLIEQLEGFGELLLRIPCRNPLRHDLDKLSIANRPRSATVSIQ